MPPRKSLLVLPLLLLTLSLTPDVARAEDANEPEYEEYARVMRISLLKGEVSLRRAGNYEWETARLNLPLVEGDTLATGQGSRLEIQVDARNFVRVGEDSVLEVVTLRDEGIALSLKEGTLMLRLARFEREREYFEMDAPRTTIAAEQPGLYRLDVTRDGEVRVTVRDDGRARIYSETSGFVLRENRMARLFYSGHTEGDWELGSASSFDQWDFWNDERERYLASRLKFEDRQRYYDPDVWGAEELDAYGDWVHSRQYGYVWRPHVTVINNYVNWAPYRYGHWEWCPPFGWTWVADEPWGWAPYHYGRWVYYNNAWCWAPRGYGYDYRRALWRPALVAFVYVPTRLGEHLAWYPLTYGQRDPRGRHWQRGRERLSPLSAGAAADLRRVNPAHLRAVSSVPAREFGVRSMRARPAPTDVAQRALNGEPVLGRLPVTPADARRVYAPGARGRGDDASGGRLNLPTARPGGNDGRAGLTIVRPAPAMPPRAIPERNTGAARRTPGQPLDEELRRARVFNGRTARTPQPNPGAQINPSGNEGTGIVSRPFPTTRRLPADGSGNNESPSFTRIRPPRPSSDEERPREPPPSAERRVRPPSAGGEGDAPRTRPTRPAEDRPAAPPVYTRPVPRERPSQNEERPPQPPPRRNDPPPRSDPAPRNDPPPSSAPPPRIERPAPREDRPAAPPPSSREPRAPSKPETSVEDN